MMMLVVEETDVRDLVTKAKGTKERKEMKLQKTLEL